MSRLIPLRPFNSLRMTHSRIHQMASQLTPAPAAAAAYNTLATIPKSNTFTSKLPPDPAFETPKQSHDAPRETLGPRIVKGAMYTYVRPEAAEEPELLGVSPRAMEDLGLQPGEEKTEDFVSLVAGNKILWNEEEGGVYPWAQCYGGMPPIKNRSILWRGRLTYGEGWQLLVYTTGNFDAHLTVS